MTKTLKEKLRLKQLSHGCRGRQTLFHSTVIGVFPARHKGTSGLKSRGEPGIAEVMCAFERESSNEHRIRDFRTPERRT